MRDPLSRELSSLKQSQDSWIRRVRDTFQKVLAPARIFPSAANGAPIHFLKDDQSKRSGHAQSLWFLTHATLIAALALLAAHPPGGKPDLFPSRRPMIRSFPAPKDHLNLLRQRYLALTARMRNIRTKRGRPNCRGRGRCKFW